MRPVTALSHNFVQFYLYNVYVVFTSTSKRLLSVLRTPVALLSRTISSYTTTHPVRERHNVYVKLAHKFLRKRRGKLYITKVTPSVWLLHRAYLSFSLCRTVVYALNLRFFLLFFFFFSFPFLYLKIRETTRQNH